MTDGKRRLNMLQKLMMKNVSFPYGLAIAVAFIMLLITGTFGLHALGYLTGTLGLSKQTAYLILTAIDSGGLYAAAFLYPILWSVLPELQVLLFSVGPSGIISF
jgi:hypothetical protein